MFHPFSPMISLLLIKLVASGVLKSHDTRQGLSVLTCVEIVNASMSVPTLCNVALALQLPVRDPSSVCVCHHESSSPGCRDRLGSLITSQGWGQLDVSGCHLLDAQPFCPWPNPLLSRPLPSHAAVLHSVSVSLVLHIITTFSAVSPCFIHG